MASRLSDLMYRALNALLACHVDAVRARRASPLAETPRRARAQLRAMYVVRQPEPVAAPERAAHRPHARLAPAGIAMLLALALVVTLALISPPPV